VIQTLSKARSLAGLRVGLAVGHSDLIAALERVKNSFNSYPLDRLAIAGATAAFADADYFAQTRAAVIATRCRLVADLEKMGFEVVPSSANFVLAKHPLHDARQLQAYLRSKAIIVRHFNQTRIAQHLRVTIGTDDQCQQLVQALSSFLAIEN
jgi:histidinol-phosphate aminotransferase